MRPWTSGRERLEDIEKMTLGQLIQIHKTLDVEEAIQKHRMPDPPKKR